MIDVASGVAVELGPDAKHNGNGVGQKEESRAVERTFESQEPEVKTPQTAVEIKSVGGEGMEAQLPPHPHPQPFQASPPVS